MQANKRSKYLFFSIYPNVKTMSHVCLFIENTVKVLKIQTHLFETNSNTDAKNV